VEETIKNDVRGRCRAAPLGGNRQSKPREIAHDTTAPDAGSSGAARACDAALDMLAEQVGLTA
jgi:hypothetical protein